MIAENNPHDLRKHDVIFHGSLFPEPVQVLLATAIGTALKLSSRGLNTTGDS